MRPFLIAALIVSLAALPAAGRSPAKYPNPDEEPTVGAAITRSTAAPVEAPDDAKTGDDPAQPPIDGELSASLANFIEKQVIARYPIFRKRVDLGRVVCRNGLCMVEGSLFADNGRPMDLLGRFIEALDGTKCVSGVLPRNAKKVDDNPKRLAFILQLTTDAKRIPLDTGRDQTFAIVVPKSFEKPVLVKIQLADGSKRSVLMEETKNPGEMIKLAFRTKGKAKLRVEYDGQKYRDFDLD